MGSLNIDVLGTSFTIKATEDEEYLNKLLGYYRQIVEEIEKTGMMKNNMQISILAGIMLCDELYKEKSKTARFSQNLTQDSSGEATKLAEDMIKKLDQALKLK